MPGDNGTGTSRPEANLAERLADLYSVAKKSPLAGIDAALDLFAETAAGRTAQDSKVLLDTVLGLIASAIGQTADLPSSDLLFDERLSHEHRVLVGACLLRLLAADASALDHADNQLRARSEGLLESLWAKLVYQKFGLAEKSERHQKFARLPDVVRRVQNDWVNTLASFNDLAQFAAFKTAVMKSLGDRPAQLLVPPFLPGNAPALRTAVFNAVETYMTAKGPDVIAARAEVNRSLSELSAAVDSKPTKYSQMYLGDFAERIGAILDLHFDASVANRPALINIKATDKKYPLHDEARRLDVAVEVNNSGSGVAYGVVVKVHVSDLEILESEVGVGDLAPGKMILPIKVRLASQRQSAELLGTVHWSDPDGAQRQEEFAITLAAQRAGIDWESLTYLAPFDLEPVDTEEELIGRREYLTQLMNLVMADRMGNAYLFGQKRVGKTSIAKTLASIYKTQSPNHLTVHVECGDYVSADPIATLKSLGATLCRSLRAAHPRLANLEIPEFEGGLAALNTFIDTVHERYPEARILLVLDEFDGLPVDLYQPGPLGDAVFKNLRTVSGKPYVSLVLVGGENMVHIWNAQGTELNKLDRVQVDYFDRAKNYGDFQDLVRAPIAKWVDVSDNAVALLYEQTAGNPFFAKLIARRLFDTVRTRHDSYVAEVDMEAAVEAMVDEVGSPRFAHFWDDGVLAPEPQRGEIRNNRRRFLLALAHELRSTPSPTQEAVVEESGKFGLSRETAERLGKEFVRRGVLLDASGTVACKIPFFGRWLANRGLVEILTTIGDSTLDARRTYEEAYVKDSELSAVVKRWGPYRGRQVLVDDLRSWLDQFGDYHRQRLALPVVQSLRFYDQLAVRSMFRTAHHSIQRDLKESGREYVTVGRQRKKSHILVSYLDGPFKSGAKFGALYVEENEIFKANAVERGRLLEELTRRDDVQAVVFVDDCVGTGKQASAGLGEFITDCSDVVASNGIAVYFVPAVGFDLGLAHIRRSVQRASIKVNVQACEVLMDADRCFTAKSTVYSDSDTRQAARDLLYEIGSHLEKSHPLGYEGGEALVVFSEGCPNNTLPALWKDSRNWKPLFPRLGLTNV